MKHRFSALDGLRGVAAIIVLLFHMRRWVGPGFFERGYVSVDLFFILSGFVLAFAYDKKFASGMTVLAFLRERVNRLGPTLWAASLFGFLGGLIAVQLKMGLTPFDICALVFASLRTAFLLPIVGGSSADAFPLDGAAWSLFAEIVVNIALALTARRLTTKTLIAIVVIGWIAVSLEALKFNSLDFGAAQNTILWGTLRAVPAFAAGVLLFRFWQREAFSWLPSVHPAILFGLWTALTLAPGGAFLDLMQTMIAAPITIVLLARYEGSVPRVAVWAGAISYPLYAIHLTILGPVLVLAPSLPLWGVVLLGSAVLLAADAIARWWEPAARLFLRKKTLPALQSATA
jgi:peptidoglycan/LPS O-acetylase OafA/YrhL